MSTNSPLSAWQLPSLLIPLHQHKKTSIPNPKQRSHFLPIVAYVYRNRFAIASQIQRRFSHVLKSDRTTRRHLAELESLGYLAVVPTRGTSPLWPKTYFCTAKGARRLRRSLESRGKPGNVIRVDRLRSNGCTADHALHELLTTELLLSVWQCSQNNPGFEVLQTERRSIPSQSAFDIEARNGKTRLEPDAWFVSRHHGKGIMYWFCELDAGTMTKDQLKAKFWRYDRWTNSQCGRDFLVQVYQRHGAENPRPAFRIVLVSCDRELNHDERRLEIVRKSAASFPGIDSRLRCIESSRVAENGHVFDLLIK